MDRPTLARRAIAALALLVGYCAVQSIVEVLHEFAHSISAWLLGYTTTPFTVVWGNPLTITGWDEGVPYDRLFPARGHPAEAIIGGAPFALHVTLVVASLTLLLRAGERTRPALCLGAYLVAAMNLGELIAYIFMRPFIPDGDTGRFNEGFDLSPWPLFTVGTLFILAALWLLARRVTPRLAWWTDGSRFETRALALFAGFVIFLWCSGLRMLALYPDPQWRTGLMGLVGFLIWLVASWRQSAALALASVPLTR